MAWKHLLRDPAVLRRLAIITAAFALGGGLYALLAPRWYRSVLTVVPARQQRPSIAGLGAELGGLAAGLAEGALGGSADAARIAAVLQSVTVTDAAIDEFNLLERYDEKYRELARIELWKHCEVKTLVKANLVELACEDRDPKFVQALLAFFAEKGNAVFRRVGVTSASEEVRFLEKRSAELRQLAEDSAARLREFQEKYKVVDLETQAKAVVSALASVNGQRIGKQLELDYARRYSSGDEATLQQLESQVGVLGAKLHALEEAPSPPPAGKPGAAGGVFPPASEVPRLRAAYESLLRDRKVAEATLVFSLQALEQARANEARDTSTFQVLDPPALPTRPHRPKRLRAVLLAAAAGLAAAVAFEAVRAARARAA